MVVRTIGFSQSSRPLVSHLVKQHAPDLISRSRQRRWLQVPSRASRTSSAHGTKEAVVHAWIIYDFPKATRVCSAGAVLWSVPPVAYMREAWRSSATATTLHPVVVRRGVSGVVWSCRSRKAEKWPRRSSQGPSSNIGSVRY